MGAPGRGRRAVPTARQRAHVRHNRAAAELRLTDADLTELDLAFPPPRRPQPLEVEAR